MAGHTTDAAGRCGSCGNDLRAKARFCDMCGSPVSARPAAGEHKQVTVLFADVVESMKLAAMLDAERLQQLMHELFNRAGAVVQRYQGTVDKFTGDGLMALFGAPLALEDHALRACIAALEIQSAARELATEVLRCDGVALHLRIGLNSGEVIAGQIGTGPGRYTAVGHPVGMAQRMEAAAPPDGVLCSSSTARLVGEAARLGPVRQVAVKGSDVPVPARQLFAVESTRSVLGRNEGVMLGRDAELARLHALLDDATGCLVGIIGAPGVGKSRLIGEFGAMATGGGADILLARCEAHTSTVPFRALSRLLRAVFQIEGLDDARAREVASAACRPLNIGVADEQILFDAMGIADQDAPPLQVSVDGRRHRLLEMMAQVVRRRPTRAVIVLEDAHWIDEPSDAVLADFAATLSLTTSILVTTYRPEFRGALHRRSAHRIRLRPLSDALALELVGQVLGGDPSLTGLYERVAGAAAGYPYFIEEIVRDLVGRGALSGSRGAYRLTGDLDEISVPATIQAVLAARIDRLPAEAKSILNAAAVVGTRFDADTLRALRPDMVSSQLAELVAAELIDQTEFVPRQRYCFHHPLVRAVAYDSQLTTTRAEAHRRLAAAIAARDRGAADENAALIATHLEAAGDDVAAHRWRMRAAEWLRPRDLLAARTEWENAQRIADRLPDGHDDVLAMRVAPRTMLMSTLLYVGDDVDTQDQYLRFRELALQLGDLRSLAIGTVGRIWSFVVNENQVPSAAALASEVEDIVDGIGSDAQARSIVLNALAFARFSNCEIDAAARHVDALLDLADAPPVELAPARALRGVIEIVMGDSTQGWRDLRQGIALARDLHPVDYAMILHYSGIVVMLGMSRAEDLVDDVCEALRRAESFGDMSALIAAQWTAGAVLLRTQNAPSGGDVHLLEQAQDSIRKRRLLVVGLAAIAADLAVDAARKGRRDGAIAELRAVFDVHMTSGTRLFAACAAEALTEILLARGAADDLAEAHRVVVRWLDRRPDIPALDLWWLKSRALLANARGDRSGYMQWAGRYLDLCERLDARGRIPHARRLFDEATAGDGS
ncbi:adenylyl cyclase [Mycobacterium sp. IS-1742]|uniref:adenylate/guanylate cyclase domain-containing protein n=1 Tax=Mycobacterium sp. IS-1742 TaxID=1772285 RepID=UPI0007403604|nr:adenylate/guanylate cyclase domain-containing protein [Mycobacterium sp. IS-1742]KUI27156.1 adenylyl cyclase [Mycobacterium sp. IS-1742]